MSYLRRLYDCQPTCALARSWRSYTGGMSDSARPVDPRAVRLRPATNADLEFLCRVHHAAMRAHVEATWGAWDAQRQRDLFLSSTDPTTHEVIELDGRPIGCRWVRLHPAADELVRLYLLPEAQRRGIGTVIVRRLLAETHAEGRSVRLRVMKRNPARRLYERLGFRVVSETETHFAMEAIKRVNAGTD